MKGMAGGLVEGLAAVNVAGVDAGCLVVVAVVALEHYPSVLFYFFGNATGTMNMNSHGWVH